MPLVYEEPQTKSGEQGERARENVDVRTDDEAVGREENDWTGEKELNGTQLNQTIAALVSAGRDWRDERWLVGWTQRWRRVKRVRGRLNRSNVTEQNLDDSKE